MCILELLSTANNIYIHSKKYIQYAKIKCEQKNLTNHKIMKCRYFKTMLCVLHSIQTTNKTYKTGKTINVPIE